MTFDNHLGLSMTQLFFAFCRVVKCNKSCLVSSDHSHSFERGVIFEVMFSSIVINSLYFIRAWSMKKEAKVKLIGTHTKTVFIVGFDYRL